MGWIQFAASVIRDVLSWPVVILVIVLLLLNPIRNLIGRIRKAKVAGVEAEFSDLLEDAEEKIDSYLESENATADANSTGTSTDTPVVVPDGSASQAEDLSRPDAIRDPSGAIILSWQKLTRALEDLRATTAGRGRPTRNVLKTLDQLRDGGYVNDLYCESVKGLMELRNQVAHGEATPNPGAAHVYIQRAHELETAAQAINEHERKRRAGPLG